MKPSIQKTKNSMKELLNKWALAVPAACLSFSFAHAQTGPVTYVYGEVVESRPIMTTVRVNQPRQECWQERVVHRQPARRHSGSSTGTILGGLIGAAVGNELGHSQKNKKVGAVAGGLLGASIGRDISRPHYSTGSNHRISYEQRCNTVDEYYNEERVSGYHVVYRYNGNTYTTRSSVAPGDNIRLKVSVTPQI